MMSESQRNAIMAWLEQDENFLRVTASSSSHRGAPGVYNAELIESNAFNELAASVNAATAHSHWDGNFAKQMLTRCLIEFKTTRRAASKPGFTLTKTDEMVGIKTIEDKLNSMCRHFVRLQRLHDPRIRAGMRGMTLMRLRKEKSLRSDLRVTLVQQQEKVVPSQASRQSDEKDTPCEAQERTEPKEHTLKQEKKVDENSDKKGNETGARRSLSPLPRCTAATEEQEEVKKAFLTDQTQVTPEKNENKKAAPAQQEQKNKEEGGGRAKEGETVIELIELTSDDEEEEDEDLPFVSSKDAVKIRRRLTRLDSKSSRSEDDDSPWLKRKLRRVEASSGVTTRSEQHHTPPRTKETSGLDKPRTPPTKTCTATPNHVKKAHTEEQKSVRDTAPVLQPTQPVSSTVPPEEETLGHQLTGAVNALTQAENFPAGGPESLKDISPVQKPVQIAKASASDLPPMQEVMAPTLGDRQSAREDFIPTASVEPPTTASISAVQQTTTPQQPATATCTPVQPRLQVPEALRSAIAQVVSQRQQLLQSQLGRRQFRQPDFSDRDYTPSEEEMEELSSTDNTPRKGRRRHNAKAVGTRRTQDPPVAGETHKDASIFSEGTPLSNEDPPAVSTTSSDDSNAFREGLTGPLMAGHIPALLIQAHAIDGPTNLDRKRGFFRAKQLAFEQFKCIRENELQQQELELLRREMKAREATAQNEIKLKNMAIRAEVIERMVLAGAAVEDIAERLTLLF